jgi:hypothetical protein
MSAASTRLSNVILTPGSAAVTAGITASGAASEIDNVEFTPHATDEFTDMILLTGSRSVVRDCSLIGLDGTAGAIGLSLNGCDQILVTRNVITGTFSTGCIENVTDETLQATITYNVVTNQGAAGIITMDASATGIIAFNSLANESTTIQATDFVPGECLCNENYIVTDFDETGIVVPTTASTS